MNVTPNYNTGPVTEVAWKTSMPPRAGNASDTAQFDHAAALDSAIKATPDIRAAEVERARDLIVDVAYPPDEIINRIASLLALKMDARLTET